ncbi:MAG: AI-2E family transporter [Anaerolineae bacterium]
MLAIRVFGVVLAPLVVAVIMAYLLSPLVNWLQRRTPLNRQIAAAVVYLAFLLVLTSIPLLLAPLVVQQITELDINLGTLPEQLNNGLNRFSDVSGITIDIGIVEEQVRGSVDQVLSPAATAAANLAVGIAGGFIWAIFIFVVAYYLLVDASRFRDWLDSWVPPAYFDEFNQLRHVLDNVWKSYFIGQLTLAIIVGVIIGGVTALLGIRSAILLGLVAAILELIPNWGYSISGAVGVIFAFLQGSTWIPLPPWAFALVVGGFYFLMWQIDTNYLVPRIIGNRLQLPPAVIIVGIIAGASVGGALGLLLAAPIIATVRVLGSYIYRRLMDLEPYVLVYESPAIGGSADKNIITARPTEAEENE